MLEYEVWDIILSAVTILASIIAVVISLCVANKQNRIALFEKRYELYRDALDFFECAYNYYRKNDRASISMIQLTELENKIDSIIEKSKFLFNEEISNILSQGKECFSCHIKYFHEASDPDRETNIKRSIEENRTAFIEKASKILKL